MSSDDEHPSDHESKKTAKSKSVQPKLVSSLCTQHPGLVDALKTLGLEPFDSASISHFASSKQLFLSQHVAESICNETLPIAKNMESAETDRVVVLLSEQKQPMTSALAVLASAVISGTKQTQTNRVARCKVTLCRGETKHKMTTGSPTRLFLALPGPMSVIQIRIAGAEGACPEYTYKLGTPSCSVDEHTLFAINLSGRGWGSQIACIPAPGTTQHYKPLTYLMFSDDTEAPKQPALRPRTGHDLLKDYNEAEGVQMRLIGAVCATRKTNDMALPFLVARTTAIRSLCFDGQKQQGPEAIAAKTTKWFDAIDIPCLFAIEGDDPWSLTGERSQLAGCCVKFVEAASTLHQYWSASKLFDSPAAKNALLTAIEKLGVPKCITDKCNEHARVNAGSDLEHVLRINCLYFIAACKIIARSALSSNNKFDHRALCRDLLNHDRILFDSLSDCIADALDFFAQVASDQSGKPQAKKKQEPDAAQETKKKTKQEPEAGQEPEKKKKKEDKEEQETTKAKSKTDAEAPKTPARGKKRKTTEDKPKSKKNDSKQRRRGKGRSKFFDEEAGDDDDDYDPESHDDEDEDENDSFVVEEGDESEEEEDYETRPNPYSQASDVDEEDSGSESGSETDAEFRTPANRKSEAAHPPQVRKPRLPIVVATTSSKRILPFSGKQEKVKQEEGEEIKRSQDQGKPVKKPRTESKLTLGSSSTSQPVDVDTLPIPAVDPPAAMAPLVPTIRTPPPVVDHGLVDNHPQTQSSASAKGPRTTCPAFPLDNLASMTLTKYLDDIAATPPTNEQLEATMRDPRLIDYQNKNLVRRIKGLTLKPVNVDDDPLPFSALLSDSDLEDLTCWVVRLRLPTVDVFSLEKKDGKSPDAQERIFHFERLEMEVDHVLQPPGDHLLDCIVEQPDGLPTQIFRVFTFIQDRERQYTRISKFSVGAKGIIPMKLQAGFKDRVNTFPLGDPNADGFIPFSNLYLLFAPKEEPLLGQLQAAFKGIYISIDNISFR